MITLSSTHFEKILAHAADAKPNECCGLIGGQDNAARNTYPMQNVAQNPQFAYEAAPEDLFAAQREMRDRGEQLLGIYHSHPRSAQPAPSQTDVRLAYYPQAVYFIVGFDNDQPLMRAFRISEREEVWQEVEYAIAGE
ncbi:MAG TPA: M67 family metallopeptidase [Pyrinomonadaceae bacterium]|nr:M67 family metallopeptidase [Pyrinomonadaceae bacterium]